MSKRLKLKKNDFGLRIHCSVCRKTFNEVSIKKCSHSDKQKYRVLVNIPLEGGVKTQKLKTKDYSKAIEEAVKFKNRVKRGDLTVITKKKKVVINEQNLLLIKAADIYVKHKMGKVEFTFMKRKDLTEDYINSVVHYLNEFLSVLKDNNYAVKQMLLKDIDAEHIEAWWKYVNHKYNNSYTINARIGAMKAFINYINKTYNLRLKNFFKDIELLYCENEIRAISKKEFDELCDAVKNKSPYYNYITKKGKNKRKSRYREYLIDAFKMGLYTGLRREEIFSLRWSDIKKVNDGNLLLVVPNLKAERYTKKEYRPKYIAIYQDLLDFLKSIGLEAKLGIDEYIIYPNRKVKLNTLKDCTSRAFKHFYAKAYPDAKEVLPFKSLRKTYLTYLSKYVEKDTIYLSSHASNTTLEKHYLDPIILAKGQGMKMFS